MILLFIKGLTSDLYYDSLNISISEDILGTPIMVNLGLTNNMYHQGLGKSLRSSLTSEEYKITRNNLNIFKWI